ncbi:MAG: hypothetical protein KGI98_15635 [Euryarchaeota archaeon]|nr:hypothetical protein [Euryarchaeota archaeon]
MSERRSETWIGWTHAGALVAISVAAAGLGWHDGALVFVWSALFVLLTAAAIEKANGR